MPLRSNGSQWLRGQRISTWLWAVASTMDSPMAFGGNSDHDINADPSCSRIPDPDMALCGSSGRSDQYDPWGQQSLQASTWLQVEAQTLPPTSALALLAAWTVGLNTDLSCSRALDPDVAFGGSKDQDLIMFSGGSSGLPYQHGPQWQPGQRLQNSPRLQPRPLSSAQPSVEPCATERRLYPWP